MDCMRLKLKQEASQSLDWKTASSEKSLDMELRGTVHSRALRKY